MPSELLLSNHWPIGWSAGFVEQLVEKGYDSCLESQASQFIGLRLIGSFTQPQN